MKRDVNIKKRAVMAGGNVLGLFTKQKGTSVMEADPRRRGGSCREEGGRTRSFAYPQGKLSFTNTEVLFMIYMTT